MEYEFKSFEVDASAFKPAVTAEELRLGNWLYSYTIFSLDDGKAAKEGCISPFRVDLKTLQMIYEQPLLVTMKPIPITPEILDKAGFHNYPSGSIDRWKKNRLYIESSMWMKDQYRFKWENMDHTGSTPITKIKFVHQLQNLYFALTGTELEINL